MLRWQTAPGGASRSREKLPVPASLLVKARGCCPSHSQTCAGVDDVAPSSVEAGSGVHARLQRSKAASALGMVSTTSRVLSVYVGVSRAGTVKLTALR